MILRRFFVTRIVVITLIIIIGGAVYMLLQPKTEEQVTSYSGSSFIQNLNIQPGAVVSSPQVITGEARGNWYFEGSFPIMLTDWDGKIIATGIAAANGDWMTNEFVPFTAKLIFDTADISGSYSDKGALILKKDNPSGLPENDDALEIPVVIK